MKGFELMNQKKIATAAIALALVTACKGSSGSKGTTGTAGPSGPVGPVGAAPLLSSVFPRTATPSTKIRIRGNGFSPTAADDEVVVNGTLLTVVSATGTEIWATGLPASASNLQEGLLTVTISGQQSNVLPISLGQPGQFVTSEVKQMGYLSAATLSADEKTAYIADEYPYDPVSGNNYGAIYQYDFETGVFTTAYTTQKITYIYSMAWGPDGKLYLGAEDAATGNSGLYRFGTAFDDSTLVALVSGQTCDITSIAWAPNGDLWMGDTCDTVSTLRASDGLFFYGSYNASGNALHFMFTPAGIYVVDNYYVTLIDGALPYSNYLNGNYYGTIGAATDDGTNLILLRRNSTGSILKVTPGFDSQTLISGGIFNNNGFVSNGSDGHFMLRLKNGDTWFSSGYASILSKVSPQGVVSEEWFSPYQEYYYAAVAGDSTFYSSGRGCNYGIGAPVIRQNVDGVNTTVAKDFCGYANFAVANGKVYGADPRGWVIEIDPAANASTVVSTNPALGIASAFATDGTSIFVAQTNTAGNYNIVKIGFGDGAQVDENFVTGLTNQPNFMQVVGSNLYWTDGAAKKVAITGGLVTEALDPALGFTNLYSIGLDMAGNVVFSDDSGTYGQDAGGLVHIITPYPLWYSVPDPFGTLSGYSYYDNVQAQVLP